MAGTVFLFLSAAARLESPDVTAYFPNSSVICKAHTNPRRQACRSISPEIDFAIRYKVNNDQRLLGKSLGGTTWSNRTVCCHRSPRLPQRGPESTGAPTSRVVLTDRRVPVYHFGISRYLASLYGCSRF